MGTREQSAADGRHAGAVGQRPLPWLVLALAATFLTYLPCVGHYFLLDDFWHLAKAQQTTWLSVWRPWLYSGSDWAAYWFDASRVHGLHEQAYFRPIVTLLYMVDLRGFGGEPAPLHGMSLGLHLAATALVFGLTWRLFGRAWISGLAAAVFGLHPGHYEAVEWIAANADAVVGLFGVLTVAAFVAARSAEFRPVWYAVSLVSFALALASKETAVSIPLVLLGAEGLLLGGEPRPGQVRRARWTWHVPFWGVLAVYGAWQASTLTGILALNEGGDYTASIASALFVPQLALNFEFYMFHLFLPYPILPVDFPALFGAHCWWLAGLGLAVLVLLLRAVAGLAGPARRTYWFGVWWAAAVLLPLSFVVPSQRMVHLPLAGFAVAVAAVAVGVAQRLREARRLRGWLSAVVVAVLMVYAGLAASYAAGLGYVSAQVHRVTSDLERELAGLPPGSEVDLLNLWQPAWMLEHWFQVKHPGAHYRIQVLTFDPDVLPASLRQHPSPMMRWFLLWFAEAGLGPLGWQWENPRTLTVSLEHGTFFDGVVEQMMPVAPEARVVGSRIEAGTFVAEALATTPDGGGVRAVRFEWKPGVDERSHEVLLWTGDRWKRERPPSGWYGPSTPAP